MTTGSNGLPVAINARPCVHCRMSAGTASVFEVGFESGNTIGRSFTSPIALIALR